MTALDPRVRPTNTGDRHSPEMVEYARDVKMLSAEVGKWLDDQGVPRKAYGGTLTLLGRVKWLAENRTVS